MFEAHFQIVRGSQRKRRQRAAARGAARGAQAPRPRRLHRAARRPLSERICAALRRAARLAHRLHRLGRARHRARRPRRRSSSTAAIWCRCATRSMRRLSPSSIWSSIRRRHGSRKICRPAPSSAIRRGCIRSTAPSGSPKPAKRPRRRLVAVADNPIDAVWSDRPAPPLGAVVLHDLRYAGEDGGGRSSRACAPRSTKRRPMRWSCPIRKRCRGCSTSAAATCRTRRSCSPSPSCRGTAGPRSMSTAASSDNDVRHRLEELADVHARRRIRARSRRARQGAARGAARSRHLPGSDRASSLPTTAARCCAAAIRSRR